MPASRYTAASLHASSVIWDIFIQLKGVPKIQKLYYVRQNKDFKFHVVHLKQQLLHRCCICMNLMCVGLQISQVCFTTIQRILCYLNDTIIIPKV